MIRNTLICAAGLMIVYAAALQVFHPLFGKAPSANLTNRLFVENYLYGASAANLIVGSSLSQRIPDSALGPDFTNLALSGGNALTGLSIMVHSPALPRRVFIEINKVSDAPDQVLLHQTLDEPAFTARRYIVALRKSYQPLSVLYGLARGSNREAPQPDLSDAQRAGLIASMEEKLSVRIPDTALAARIAQLRVLVEEAHRRGISPIFFEMPIEPSLSQNVQPQQIRIAVRNAFPRECWLDVALPGGAHTNDGVHLQMHDAAAAGAILKSFPGCAGR